MVKKVDALRPERDHIGNHDPAGLFEALFERDGWPPKWRDGVYDFHHYHSTANDMLGFVGGHATLRC